MYVLFMTRQELRDSWCKGHGYGPDLGTQNVIVIMVTEMEMATNETGRFAKEHEERLLRRVEVEAIQLLDNSELVRRLKRRKPSERV